jgi:HD-like signal output (HDOD) protein
MPQSGPNRVPLSISSAPLFFRAQLVYTATTTHFPNPNPTTIEPMGILRLADLQPGMTLAADLVSPQGRLLLHAGARMDERALRMCKIWGVVEADVDGVHDAAPEGVDRAVPNGRAAADPEVLERARALLDARLGLSDPRHPAVREVRRLCLPRVAAAVAAGRHAPPGFAPLETPPTPIPDDETAGDARVAALSAEDVVAREVELASLPDIFAQIMEALKNPSSSAAHVADVIARDVSLSAKLLRLVNSPFYGYPQRIDSLARAVTIIGSNQLTSLALGISVITLFDDVDPALIDMRSFWRHSVACAVLARAIAVRRIHVREERFFVAGLLHDIGPLVMLRRHPGPAARALAEAARRGVPGHQAEAEIWEFDHSLVASLLLEKWLFPMGLEQSIRHHHAPLAAQDPPDAAVLHLADFLAHALGYASGGAAPAPPLAPAAWEALGLPKNVLEPVADLADSQIASILDIFCNGHDHGQ